MNTLRCKHIDFVPNKCLREPTDDNERIFVFTSKQNGRTYKKKKFEMGCIFKHPKTKGWAFYQAQKICMSYEPMLIVAEMLFKLDKGLIIYDGEKGEFRDKYAK